MLNVGKWIAIGVLALPPIEILAFMLVAAAIGLAGAVALMLATSVAGVMLLRSAGRGRMARLRAAVGGQINDQVDGRFMQGPGLTTVMAGILLVIPGFVTDALGALLLVPGVRGWLGATIRHAVVSGRRRADQPGVIDLDPREWERVSETKLRKPRKPRQANKTG